MVVRGLQVHGVSGFDTSTPDFQGSKVYKLAWLAEFLTSRLLMQESNDTESTQENSSGALEPALSSDASSDNLGVAPGSVVVAEEAPGRKLFRGLGILAVIGVTAEMLVCTLFCYLLRSLSFGNGAEYVVTGGFGLLAGFATATTVICLLFRSWVVGISLVLAFGVGARLVWLATWKAAELLIDSLYLDSDFTSMTFVFEEPVAAEWATLCCIPPGLFVACIPLLLARAIRGWRLVTNTHLPHHRSPRLEDILLSTAIVASMLVFLRVPSQLFDMDFMSTISATLIGSLWLGVLGVVTLIMAPIAFSARRTDDMAVAWSILLSVIGIAVLLGLVLVSLAGGPLPGSAVGMFMLASVAAAVGATACLIGLRLSGLRLVSVSSIRQAAAPLPASHAEIQTIDVLAEDTEDGKQSAQAVDSVSDVSNLPNRLAASGILAIACIVGIVVSNVESGRQRELQVWNDFAVNNKAAGSAVRIRGNKLTGLNAGRSTTPAEIRGQLVQGLETLSLREAEVDDAFLSEVGQILDISSLDLYGTNITGAGLQHLLDAGHGHFQYLGIGKTQATQEEMARFLEQCNVHVLDLSDMSYSGEDIDNFPRLSISGLVLRGNDITEEWLEEYLSDPQIRASLEHLDVTGLPLTGKFLDALAGSSINSLILDSTQVTDDSIKILAQAAQLQTLSIRDTQITANGLPGLASLQKLILGQGLITETQIGTIAKQTETLVIDQPDFTGEDLDLSQAAVFNLDLSGTSLTDIGLKQLVAKSNQSISSLRIAGTNVSDMGLSCLNTLSIYEFDVSDTQVSVDGILSLPEFYGTLRVAPGQFTERELGRLRSNYYGVEVGPESLIPRVLPISLSGVGY